MIWLVGTACFATGFVVAMLLGRFHDRKVAGHWLETPPSWKSPYEDDA